MSLNVLYEDNHIIVVTKPVNMPVQADDTGDIDLLSSVKAYIKQKYNKPGEVYCGLVHRLDRPVGGVMVFARTSKAASRLMPQFAEKGSSGAKKSYAAVTEASHVDPPRAKLAGFILKDEATRSSRMVPEGTGGAKQASLYYSAVSEKGGLALLDIDLHTGRHHQIRVQLASSGMPIWGDQRYNPNAVPGQQIALWAYGLEIEHPVKHERMRFTALPPEELGVWARFGDELRGMVCGLPIVYADGNIFIINKPSGVSVAEADGGGDTCEARLASVFGKVFPVHRIDAVTSGLLIFARNERAAAELEAAIKERSIEKNYLLLVKGSPRQAGGRIRLFAVKDGQAAFVRTYDKPVQGAAEMITDYKVIGSAEGVSLVKATLVTGRTHQIRASFAHIGCPILGDDKYGDREFNRGERYRSAVRRFGLCLCAAELAFAFDKASPLAYLNGKRFGIEAPFGDAFVRAARE